MVITFDSSYLIWTTSLIFKEVKSLSLFTFDQFAKSLSLFTFEAGQHL